MRTLQEKYNGIQEGKFSKDQFLVEARQQLPNLVTRYNGYDDAIQILKNRGMIQEASFPKAKADKTPDYRFTPAQTKDEYSMEQITRGLRVELEAMGVYCTPTVDEYVKAEAKMLKNLAKDPIFYTNQLAKTTNKVDLHDKMTPVDTKQLFKTSAPEKSKAEGNVDTFNGMKKAQIKEGFKRLIKKVLSEDVSTTRDPLEDYMESIEIKPEAEKDTENYKTENEIGITDREVSKRNITPTQLQAIAKRAGDTVPDAKNDLMDLMADYGDRIPVARVKEILRHYDLTPQDLKKPATVGGIEEAVDNNQDVIEFSVNSEDLDKALNTYFGKNLSHNGDNYTLPHEDFDNLMDYLRNEVGNQAEDQVSIATSNDMQESQEEEEAEDCQDTPEYIHESGKSLSELLN